eukprot:tig00020510_g9912.t1
MAASVAFIAAPTHSLRNNGVVTVDIPRQVFRAVRPLVEEVRTPHLAHYGKSLLEKTDLIYNLTTDPDLASSLLSKPTSVNESLYTMYANQFVVPRLRAYHPGGLADLKALYERNREKIAAAVEKNAARRQVQAAARSQARQSVLSMRTSVAVAAEGGAQASNGEAGTSLPPQRGEAPAAAAGAAAAASPPDSARQPLGPAGPASSSGPSAAPAHGAAPAVSGAAGPYYSQQLWPPPPDALRTSGPAGPALTAVASASVIPRAAPAVSGAASAGTVHGQQRSRSGSKRSSGSRRRLPPGPVGQTLAERKGSGDYHTQAYAVAEFFNGDETAFRNSFNYYGNRRDSSLDIDLRPRCTVGGSGSTVWQGRFVPPGQKRPPWEAGLGTACHLFRAARLLLVDVEASRKHVCRLAKPSLDHLDLMCAP